MAHTASLRLLSFSLVAALGCGSTVELPEKPPPEPLACLAHLAPRPLPPFAAGALCDGKGGFSGQSLVTTVDFDLVGVDPLGQKQILYRFFPDLEATHSPSRAAVLSRGDLIAAAIAALPNDAGVESTVSLEVVVVHPEESAVLARQRFDVPYENWGNDLVLTGNDRGLFTCGYRFGDNIATLVLDATNAVFGPLDGFVPITDPDERGYVAVQDERDEPDRPVFWLDPCTLARTPARRNDLSRGGSITLGPALVDYDVTAQALVREREGEEARYPLNPSTAYWIDAHPSGWILFATKDPAVVFTADARTGAQRSFSIKLPQGLRRYDAIPGPSFDGAAREVHVTSDGRITLPMRNDAEGRLYVTDDGSTWQALGAPIGEVYRAFSAEAGGTVLHFGSDFAVSLPAWDPPPAGEQRIDGMSIQLLRPASGTAPLLEASNTRYIHLTPDGTCASYAIGDSIFRVNASTTEKTSIKLTADEYWSLYATFTWRGGDDVTFLPQ